MLFRSEGASDGVDRITLCRLLAERFVDSRLVPRAMLLLAEEAERVAETLSQRARRRLAGVSEADLRDYYLSDSGLDRYSKLGVVFDFNESTGEFVYDGGAYRELVKRFPRGEEAALARQRLEFTRRKMEPPSALGRSDPGMLSKNIPFVFANQK